MPCAFVDISGEESLNLWDDEICAGSEPIKGQEIQSELFGDFLVESVKSLYIITERDSSVQLFFYFQKERGIT